MSPSLSDIFRSPKSFFFLGLVVAFFPLQKVGAQRIWDGPALSYSNVEFGWERRSFDDAGVGDADGFHAGISIAPIPLLYFAGDFHYANADYFLGDVDFMDARAGAGLRATLFGAVSIYAEGGIAYGKYDPQFSADGYDSAGFYVEPGIKVGLLGRLEASVAADLVVLDEETLVGLKAGLMLGLTNHFGITLDGSVNDRTDYFGVGVRLSW